MDSQKQLADDGELEPHFWEISGCPGLLLQFVQLFKFMELIGPPPLTVSDGWFARGRNKSYAMIEKAA